MQGTIALRFVRYQSRTKQASLSSKVSQLIRDKDREEIAGQLFLEAISNRMMSQEAISNRMMIQEDPPFLAILKWIVENWDEIAPIIEWLINLFSDFDGGTV